MMHGGNIYTFANTLGCSPEQILDFSANINAEQAVTWQTLPAITLNPYSEPDYAPLKNALLQRYPQQEDADIEVFNGASVAIFALLRHLQPEHLVLYTPLYGEYARIATQLGCQISRINRFDSLQGDIPKNSTVIFVNPSTPDGRLYAMSDLLERWQSAQCTIIVDESFLDFCTADSVMATIKTIDKLYVIKSLSKFYGCAGIRIGFISAKTHAIKALRAQEPAWKLSSFDMAYMQKALENSDFIAHTRRQTKTLRELLYQALQDSGLFAEIYPSHANFLLARLKKIDGHHLQKRLATARILMRVCENFDGLNSYYVRFAVKDAAAIAQLAQCLQDV